MKFELGPGMKCDLDLLIERRMFIQASSGGGKSRTLRRICEQTHGKIPQIIIDPEGELVTLREKFDYVLAAGTGGDTQAHPRTAARLAEKLLELRVSAIIDLYELKRQQQQEFIKAFFTALMEVPKRLWTPRLIVVDEAQLFAPEGVKSETTAEVIDLATRGRKRGHVLIAATQRIGMFDKNVAAVLHNKLIGFTSLDTDLKRAAFELGFDKEQMLGLRELPPMHFWGFGPALTRAPTLVEVGPHVSTHPKHGQKVMAAPPPPTEKIKALLPQLADLPAEAEQKARTEADLRKELSVARATITRLERQAPVRIEPRVETKVERVAVPMLTEEHLKGLRAAAAEIQMTFAGVRGLVERLAEDRGALTDALTAIDRAIAQATRPVPTPKPQPARPAPRAAVRPLPPVPKSPEFSGTDEALGGLGQRLLNALAYLETIGVAAPTRWQAALFAESSAAGGYFENTLGKLRSSGYVSYPTPGAVQITDAGRAVATIPERTPTQAELHDLLCQKLGGLRTRLLRALIDAYPDALTREELGERAGAAAKGGYFENQLGSMRTAGLVEYPVPGQVRAAPVLFLEGVA